MARSGIGSLSLGLLALDVDAPHGSFKQRHQAAGHESPAHLVHVVRVGHHLIQATWRYLTSRAFIMPWAFL